MPGRIMGLFFGVNMYQPNSGFSDLRFCANDANALRLLFEAKSSIETLVCEINAVSVGDVRSALELLTEQKLSTLDTVIFQFAGHGFSRTGKDYIAFSDSRMLEPESVIELGELIGVLRSSGAGRLFVILDCCRAIAPRGDDITTFRMTAPTLDHAFDATVFIGCSIGQFSQEHESLGASGHGVFTAALCSILERFDRIPLFLLERRTKEVSAQICQRYGLPVQVPQLIGPLSLAAYDLLKLEHVEFEVARRRVIVISGPAESGKTTLGQLLQNQLGHLHIEMSRYVKNRQKEYMLNGGNDMSRQDFVEGVLWQSGDFDVIARDALSELRATPGDAVITGARRPEEIEAFLNADLDCLLIYLHANSRIRWGRLLLDNEDWHGPRRTEFVQRNLREFGWGLAKTGLIGGTEILINEDTPSDALLAIDELVRNRFQGR
jgi:cytidylate kinase